jgi:hypothetical protein
MFKQLALAATALAALNAHALTAGDIAFNSFNADEDGFSIVALADITANTTIYFGDNEYSSGAFNTGESYSKWVSGASLITAGTVIRFTAVDTTSLAASLGAFTRETVASSSNWGLSASNETLYAYQGTSATAPTRPRLSRARAKDSGSGTAGVTVVMLKAVVLGTVVA